MRSDGGAPTAQKAHPVRLPNGAHAVVQVEVRGRVDFVDVRWIIGSLWRPAFEAFRSTQVAPAPEHVPAGWMQSPVVSFTGLPKVAARNLQEAVVQRQVVADGVLLETQTLTQI